MTSPLQHSAPPPSVSLAQKLMYALAALSVIGTLLSLLDTDAIREMAPAGTDPDTFATATITTSVVITVISVVIWVLLARFVGRGKGWARIVATVLAALGILLSLLTLGGTAITTVVGIIGLLVYVALIVVLWRKDASAYFKSAGAPRQTVADPGYPQV